MKKNKKIVEKLCLNKETIANLNSSFNVVNTNDPDKPARYNTANCPSEIPGQDTCPIPPSIGHGNFCSFYVSCAKGKTGPLC